MTLQDLWMIIRHYYKAVILVPVLCALLVAGGSGLPGAMKGSDYVATSRLMVTDPTGLLGSSSLANLIDVFAQEKAGAVADDGANVKVDTDVSSQSVEFTVTAPTADLAVDLANGLAERTRDTVRVVLADQGDAFLQAVNEIGSSPLAEEGVYVASGATATDRAAALRSCSYTISSAVVVLPGEKSIAGLLKYAAVGLLGGLFLVICALAFVDSVRRPIKSKNDVLNITDVPILAEGATQKSVERLWVNLGFVVDDEFLESICILPVSGGVRTDICDMLRANADSDLANVEPPEGIGNGGSVSGYTATTCVDIVACDSVQEDMTSAKIAHEASATVLVVRPWADKAADVVSVLEELVLAKARVAGIMIA